MRKRKKTKNLEKRVKKLEKANKQNRPELQFTDTTASNADIYTTPTVVKIQTENSGVRLTIKSFQIIGHIKRTLSNSNQWEHYRVVIFTDKSNEGGAIPSWDDVYDDASGLSACLSLRYLGDDVNEGQRFKILYDKRVKLISDDDTNGRVIFDSQIFDHFRKLNIRTIDNASGWYEAGGLYLAFVGTTATTQSDFTYNIRTRYIVHPNQ